MDKESLFLYKTNMDYFDDLQFLNFNHLKDYRLGIDRVFPDRYALNYAHDGHVFFRMDNEPAAVLEWPVAYWTWPGPRFRYGLASGPGGAWNHRYVAFSGARAERWRETGLMPVDRQAPPYAIVTEPQAFRADFDRMLDFLRGGPDKHAEAVLALEGLWVRLHKQPSTRAVFHPRYRDMQSLLNRVAAQPALPWDFRREAADMGMTPAHLRRLFRLFADGSPAAFAQRKRLEQAAHLLRETDMPVKHVAKACGMPDLHYFSKRFARHYALPPATYRRTFASPHA